MTFTQHWMSNNASESEFESPGCDCSECLIPDRGGRYTRMRSWEAGDQSDRENGRVISVNEILKSIFKVQFRQSSMTSVLTIAGHVSCPLGLYTDYICPSQPTRPRHREENRESGRPVRSFINLWSVRKRERLEVEDRIFLFLYQLWVLDALGIFSHRAFRLIQQTRCLGRIHVTTMIFTLSNALSL